MIYFVEFTKKADKQFSKIDKSMRERLIAVLYRCRIRPYDHAERLIGSPYFKLKVGEYRLLLDIDNRKLTIFVIEVGHRKNIYKKL